MFPWIKKAHRPIYICKYIYPYTFHRSLYPMRLFPSGRSDDLQNFELCALVHGPGFNNFEAPEDKGMLSANWEWYTSGIWSPQTKSDCRGHPQTLLPSFGSNIGEVPAMHLQNRFYSLCLLEILQWPLRICSWKRSVGEDESALRFTWSNFTILCWRGHDPAPHRILDEYIVIYAFESSLFFQLCSQYSFFLCIYRYKDLTINSHMYI